VGEQELSEPYLEAIRRGFNFARELGRVCGPVHLLVGISEGAGPAAAALSAGRPLAGVVAAAGDALGDGAPYLHMQAQGAARLFAASLGQRVGAEHLLVALLDQGRTEVMQALGHAGADPGTVRRAALAAIGVTDGQPPLTLPPLTPAGTMDRPALPLGQLDGGAWSVLRWRQDHLPLDYLRRPTHRQALSRLEQKAAWRVADQLGLDDDQRYSLIRHHGDQVEQRMAAARPDLATPPRARTRPRHRRGLLNVTVGWDAWLQNRRVNLRDRWFRIRTFRYYRGAPQPAGGTAQSG
jgi:Clp amino terminal domain, pathogenicity island component